MSRWAERAGGPALAAASLAAALGVGECSARLWVALRWTPEEVRVRTRPLQAKGRFEAHPSLPYVPRAGWAETGHNALGFRGAEIAREKPPGTSRVVALGASTTYGIYVEPAETYAAVLEARLRAAGRRVEVVNAGVPGWVSTESARSLESRILPLEPDLVVVYHGRNDVFAQAFRNFRADYAHYRKPDYDLRTTNARHKAVNRVSHLFMLLVSRSTHTWGEHFGWSDTLENPPYGSVRWENQPDADALVANLADPRHNAAWRRALERIAERSRAAGARVLFSTMAFDGARLATGLVPAAVRKDPRVRAAVADQVAENNAILRALAGRLGVPVAETAAIAERPEWLVDDCHRNAAGHAAHAAVLQAAIARDGLLEVGSP